MAQEVVADAGPLISLEKLEDGHAFLCLLYRRIIIPPKVLEEVAVENHAVLSDYLKERGMEDFVVVQTPSKIPSLPELNRLHDGESQAIALALELDLPLLIEETAGRRIALGIGLQVSGIAGQLLKAFREDLLEKEDARRKLQELFDGGRINRKIFGALNAGLGQELPRQ
ncbi:MAG: hypothetical protein HOC74_14495 [Gemmatimonadetes bacterium]|jgi:predicted nucleic acid-binding protein|nr:hypothetical protein [Gemmatimonadota bacterium]